MMNLPSLIDRIHLAMRSSRWLQLFTAGTRILLAIGFIFPGLQKFEDRPFTVMPPSAGVWAEYFHVLYRTGYYYDFIGGCQIVAAALLLIPATAHIGNLIYFPIILNIAVLTNATFGSLTPYITLLMLLASTWLLCWDLDRFKPLFRPSSLGRGKFDKHEFWLVPLLALVAGSVMLALASYFRIGPEISGRGTVILLTFSALCGLVLSIHHRYMK